MIGIFKKLFKPLLTLAVISFTIGYIKPSVIPDEALKAKMEVFKSETIPEVQVEAGKVLGATTEKVKSVKIPNAFSEQPEEIVVEEVLASFSDQVKELSEQQVQEIKAQLCEDFLDVEVVREEKNNE